MCPRGSWLWLLLVAGSLLGACAEDTPSGGAKAGAAGALGGGGSDVGGAGSGGEAGSPERIFLSPNFGHETLEQCATDGSCKGGGRCFELTEKIRICDQPQPVESLACTPESKQWPPDECGCGGLACAAGQVCRSVETQCSCGPTYKNTCVASACVAPGECAAGEVCTPSRYILAGDARCFRPRCATDADCTLGPLGRCSLLIRTPLQSGQAQLTGVECVYKGSGEAPDACAQGTPALAAEGYYRCATP